MKTIIMCDGCEKELIIITQRLGSIPWRYIVEPHNCEREKNESHQ
jgi:hypothetical protein